MSPRIAALLCALLVLTGCATNPEPHPAALAATPTAAPTPTAQSPYTDAEADYLSALNEPLAALSLAIVDVLLADLPAKPADHAKALLDAMPYAAPATLAVIAYYRSAVYAACYQPLVSHLGDDFAHYVDPCLTPIDTLRLELARLYAARGAYPPGYQP